MMLRTAACVLGSVLLLSPSALASTMAPQMTAPTQAADLSGTWDVSFQTQQGQYPAQIVLKKGGDGFEGTVSSDMGSAPIQAQVKGGEVSLWFTFQTQQGSVDIEMDGALTGDAMKGPLVMGGAAGGNWSATRKKDPNETKDVKDPKDAKAQAADFGGTWTLSVTMSEMAASPTLTLKQDGDKLTGTYTSTQYGSFPLTGTVTGSSFTISFPMAVEGNNLNVTGSGTIDGDAMKGTLNYGDMMSGSFTGARKK